MTHPLPLPLYMRRSFYCVLLRAVWKAGFPKTAHSPPYLGTSDVGRLPPTSDDPPGHHGRADHLAAAAIPVEADADMIGPDDLEGMEQMRQEIVEARLVGFGIGPVDLAPLGRHRVII